MYPFDLPIVDAHAHLFPERIAAAAVHATNEFYRYPRTAVEPGFMEEYPGSGTVKDLLRAEREAGISRAMVFSCATNARQVPAVNTFVSQVCAETPAFIGVGTMFIDYPDYEGECDRMLRLGLRGVKLHPDIQRFAVDDPRLYPLYEIMQEKGLFLITHAGDHRFDFSGPKRLRRVAEDFPQMKLICAHFCGWSQWEEARSLLKRDNIYMDTSSTIPFGGREPALQGFRHFDPTHIFFGSDYPMWSPKTELASILSLGLDDETLEGVLYRNLERFLDLP